MLRLCSTWSRRSRNRSGIGPNRWHRCSGTTGGADYSRKSPPNRKKRPIYFPIEWRTRSSPLTKSQPCGTAADFVHGSSLRPLSNRALPRLPSTTPTIEKFELSFQHKTAFTDRLVMVRSEFGGARARIFCKGCSRIASSYRTTYSNICS